MNGACNDLDIICIENDLCVCKIFWDTLKTDDCAVDIVTEATDGISKFRSRQYDLLIIGESVSNKSGIEIAHNLQTEFPELPILIIIKTGGVEAACKVLELENTNFIFKEDLQTRRKLIPSLVSNLFKKSGFRKPNSQQKAAKPIFNITERIEAEEALKKSAERLNQGERLGKTVSWEMNQRLDAFVYLSENANNIFKIPPGEFTTDGLGGRLHIHPDEIHQVNKVTSDRAQNPSSFDIKYRFIHPDGKIA